MLCRPLPHTFLPRLVRLPPLPCTCTGACMAPQRALMPLPATLKCFRALSADSRLGSWVPSLPDRVAPAPLSSPHAALLLLQFVWEKFPGQYTPANTIMLDDLRCVQVAIGGAAAHGMHYFGKCKVEVASQHGEQATTCEGTVGKQPCNQTISWQHHTRCAQSRWLTSRYNIRCCYCPNIHTAKPVITALPRALRPPPAGATTS